MKRTKTRRGAAVAPAREEVEEQREAEGAACCEAEPAAECCASPPDLSVEEAGAGARIKEKFTGFVREAGSEGALSVREKELMAIALSLVCKCEPCAKIHIGKARALGVSDEEIEEAAWMAIAFGGAPTMMFYESIKEKK